MAEHRRCGCGGEPVLKGIIWPEIMCRSCGIRTAPGTDDDTGLWAVWDRAMTPQPAPAEPTSPKTHDEWTARRGEYDARVCAGCGHDDRSCGGEQIPCADCTRMDPSASADRWYPPEPSAPPAPPTLRAGMRVRVSKPKDESEGPGWMPQMDPMDGAEVVLRLRSDIGWWCAVKPPYWLHPSWLTPVPEPPAGEGKEH